MNVLIIDDQPEVVEGTIKGVNWDEIGVMNVYGAFHVNKAKDIFLKEEIHLLLCDIEMPEMNGFEFLAWAKEIKSDIASIFLSAHEEFLYAKEAVKMGSFDYITQPAPYEEVQAAVKNALEKIQKNRENLKQIEEYKKIQRENIKLSGVEQTKLEGNESAISMAINYIKQNLDKDFSRGDIASKVFLNPEYLSRRFKKEIGVSLNEYIMNEKMKVAQTLLSQTNIPVGLVATKVGYTNFSYFSQLFRKHSGFSPLEYRQLHK